ncbi:hypothetical protein ACMYSK_05375 [Klebsiella sp. I138]|uniref:hypothetical protein n=1 Tax=Klebsiella sp. I138 TaxID=2755385 RepID=UPI003DA90A98
MTLVFNLRGAPVAARIAHKPSLKMFIFVLITPRVNDGFLLLLAGGEFPCAEERSVHISQQFVIRTRISENWLIHREAPGAAHKYTGIP